MSHPIIHTGHRMDAEGATLLAKIVDAGRQAWRSLAESPEHVAALLCVVLAVFCLVLAVARLVGGPLGLLGGVGR